MQIVRNLDVNIGPRFLAVNNESLVKTVEHVLGSEVRTIQPRSNPSKVFVTADLSQYTEKIESLGGTLIPRLWLRNSNDGTSGLHVGVGFMRLVCTNGLTVPMGDTLYTSIRHVDGPKANSLLDVLPDVMQTYVERVKSGELIEEALDAQKIVVVNPIDVVGSLDLPLRVKNDVIFAIAHGRYRDQDTPSTSWGLYNLVNERLRMRSRSQYAAANRDVTLLQDIVHLAEAQVSLAA